jgi:hypothetical protein
MVSGSESVLVSVRPQAVSPGGAVLLRAACKLRACCLLCDQPATPTPGVWAVPGAGAPAPAGPPGQHSWPVGVYPGATAEWLTGTGCSPCWLSVSGWLLSRLPYSPRHKASQLSCDHPASTDSRRSADRAAYTRSKALFRSAVAERNSAVWSLSPRYSLIQNASSTNRMICPHIGPHPGLFMSRLRRLHPRRLQRSSCCSFGWVTVLFLWGVRVLIG